MFLVVAAPCQCSLSWSTSEGLAHALQPDSQSSLDLQTSESAEALQIGQTRCKLQRSPVSGKLAQSCLPMEGARQGGPRCPHSAVTKRITVYTSMMSRRKAVAHRPHSTRCSCGQMHEHPHNRCPHHVQPNSALLELIAGLLFKNATVVVGLHMQTTLPGVPRQTHHQQHHVWHRLCVKASPQKMPGWQAACRQISCWQAAAWLRTQEQSLRTSVKGMQPRACHEIDLGDTLC